MLNRIAAGAFACLVFVSPALAETVEVKMVNKGQNGGTMVFEPDFVRVAPGDTVKFVVADKGHNAETIDGMIPGGAAGFEGKINEEIAFTPEAEGLFAVKCKPHWSLGMVMLVAVGEIGAAPDGFMGGKMPPKAKQRFEALLEKLAEPAG